MGETKRTAGPTGSIGSSSNSDESGRNGADDDKRQNLALRGLVDEMLATIRVTVNRDLWTPEERARAEADLSRIMSQVQSETLRPRRGGGNSAA